MIRFVLRAMVVLATFTTSVLVSTVVHLDLRVARQAVADLLSRGISSGLAGALRVTSIERLDVFGASGANVTLQSPEGAIVATAYGVSARIDPVSLLSALIGRKAIPIRDLSASYLDLLLEDDTGELSIASALASRNPSGPPTRNIELGDVSITHAWVHGAVHGVSIDADVDDAQGRMALASTISLNARGMVDFRQAPATTADAIAFVKIAVEDDALELLADGRLGKIPIRGALNQNGELALIVASVSGDDVRAAIPAAPIHAPLALVARARGATAFVMARIGTGNVAGDGQLVGKVAEGLVRARSLDVAAMGPSVPPYVIDADLDVRGNTHAFHAAGEVRTSGAFAKGVVRSNEGKLDLDAGVVISSLDRVLEPLHLPIRVLGSGSGRIIVRSQGSRLEADATGHLRAPRANGVAVDRVDFSVSGTKRGSEIAGRLDATIVAADMPIAIAARGGVIADGVSIERFIAGTAKSRVSASGWWQHDHGHVTLDASPLDVGEVQRLTGTVSSLSGTMRLQSRVDLDPRSIRGWAVAQSNDLTIAGTRDISGRVEISTLGGAWSVVARASSKGLGWAALDMLDVRPSGSPFSIASWKHAQGFAKGAGWLALDSIDGSLSGWSHATMVGERKTANPVLEIVGDSYGARTFGRPFDVRAGAEVSRSGEVGLHGLLRWDSGATAAATVLTAIDWRTVLSGHLPRVETLPLDIRAAVRHAELDSICELARKECSGQVSGELGAHGPMTKLTADLRLAVFGLRSNDIPIVGPIDGQIDARYSDNHTLQGVLHATSRAAGDLDAEFNTRHGSSFVALRARSLGLEWRGVDRTFRSRVDGSVAARDLFGSPRIAAGLRFSALEVDGVARNAVVDASATLDGGDRRVRANARISDGTSVSHARLEAGVIWQSHLPHLDPERAIDLELDARALDLGLIGRLVPNIEVFRGRADGTIAASVVPAKNQVVVSGDLAVNDAVVESPLFDHLHDVTGHFRIDRNGDARIDHAHALGRYGRIDLEATGKIEHGVVRHAVVSAAIGSGDRFPLVIEGVHLADIWGRAVSKFDFGTDAVHVRANLPTLHARLPPTSARDLQPLEKNPSVRAGVRRADGSFVELPLVPPTSDNRPHSTMPVLANVIFGDDVVLERDDMLRARLSGRPQVVIGPNGVTMHGTVQIVDGTIDVSGKRFRIERALVAFDGPPDNPRIDATATWQAADKTIVYANYLGRLKSGRVTLRSEPALSRDEIVELLVFGTTSGPAMSGGPSTTVNAIATGASLLTQPLNKALQQLAHLDIRTRIGHSGPNPAPELEAQIANNISATISYVLGTPTGPNPDKAWISLAWQFAPRWTLDTTIGDQGSSIVEVGWHLRY